jgi:hypothetical protein
MRKEKSINRAGFSACRGMIVSNVILSQRQQGQQP